MSAETLHKAASLMRERADVATRGPWVAFRAQATNPLDRAPVVGVTRDLAVDYDTDLFATQKCRAEDTAHIASWHPAVALAVADWLDDTAEYLDDDLNRNFGGGRTPRFDTPEAWTERNYRASLAVARTYLGESA